MFYENWDDAPENEYFAVWRKGEAIGYLIYAPKNMRQGNCEIAIAYDRDAMTLIVSVLNSASLKNDQMKSLKEDREKQWGSGEAALGWERWCSRTFLEMIRAKVERALQCLRKLQRLGTGQDLTDERGKLLFDAHDSIKDMLNYGRRLHEKMQEVGWFESQDLR